MIPVHVITGATKVYLPELRRYAFNTVSAIVTLYIVFVVMFFGAQAVAGPAETFGSTMEALVVGSLVWVFALIGFGNLGQSVTQEAQQGTLEQLFLSPWGFGWVALGRLLAAFGAFTLINSLQLALMRRGFAPAAAKHLTHGSFLWGTQHGRPSPPRSGPAPG